MFEKTIEEKIAVLDRVKVLGGLKGNREAQNILVHLMKEKAFKADHVVIQEGKVEHEFFILLKGQVSVYKNTPENASYKVAILKDEQTPALGEGGLIEGDSRTATVRCDTDCQFLVLNRTDFNVFCEKYPQWALPIVRNIATFLISRLHQSNNDVILLHKALMHEIRG
ncbi:MAG TPA: cyclic nucleotide-binding domain-containing protein [Pseudobdellovibrionaceae bacterium]|nr:cyclic nucleotide-binding domain-containing protein [Pseudobdellovibrionaceae bacterium]